MTHQELREKYLSFFEIKGHKRIPSAPLLPENDATVLFTTAGMHPLVPFLLGEKHPAGNRLTSCQKCVRTGDIEEVGDNRHLTFFEMLGNWSLGDYFKKEAIEWSWEFLTKKEWLGLDPKRIYVTVFEGDNDISRDEKSIDVWRDVFKNAGMVAEVAENKMIKKNVKIIPLGKEDNFWIAGVTGPCGSDTEIYYDTRPSEGEIIGDFREFVDNFRLVEIWNDVFMEFNRDTTGKHERLSQQNVDTGMGLERTLFVLNDKADVYETELFVPIIKEIEILSGKKYQNYQKEFRIIADHIKAAVFMLAEKLEPSNVGRGYVLRRLIRRAVRYGKLLNIQESFAHKLIASVLDIYKDVYPELKENKDFIEEQLVREEEKFSKTLEKGLKEFEKGVDPFILFTTYGFPIEIIEELAKEKGMVIDKDKFQKEFERHQELSRTASAGMFKGGLADNSEQVVKYHTTTHLLHAALRQVLGQEVGQKGSNLNSERLRFDFSYNQKMTPEQIKQVEDIVNEKIQEKLSVKMEEMNLGEAKNSGAIGLFAEKYGDKVKVYSIGDFSKEICGGPHVENIGILGRFKIIKEEAVSAGIRRIKAILE